MHRFSCFPSDGSPLVLEQRGAHLVGSDNVPQRGEIEWQDGAIVCKPRTQDPVGLSLLWRVDGQGTLQLQTTRLPVRERPYHLHVELARHVLMRISVKREEWGLFDYPGMDEIAAQIADARDAFVQALQFIDDPTAAARHADEALKLGLAAATAMTRFHADVFLTRRHQGGGFAKPFLGIAVPPANCDASLVQRLGPACDFVRLPIVWREVQPTEHDQRFEALEQAVKVCTAGKLGVRAGPLLNFGVRSVPDWMYIWENDFESIYEATREYVQRTVQRLSRVVSSWTIISGIHAEGVFGFSFEQVMELTRMAATVTKQVAPRSQVLIDLTQPWGEYYARSAQTIPPLFFADMVVQGGISFDGFGLQLLLGVGSDGYHLRDPLQISSLIDKLANLGKPLHITALGAPAAPARGGPKNFVPGGEWVTPWSEQTQADWLELLCQVALSKPYVETVCLQPLRDSPENVIPSGGLLRPDGAARPAFERLAALRKRLSGPAK